MPWRLKRNKVLSRAVFLGYLVGVLALTDYCFYLRYLQTIPEPEGAYRKDSFNAVPFVDPAVMKQIMYVETSKRSCFVNYPALKAPGTVRIGCFGDSFTFGAEVDEAHDYPAALQEIFRRRGYEWVQVLNFGTSGYGFHQSYLLWRDVAPKFDLDYVLLGPMGFQWQRAVSFYSSDNRYVSRSRFILDGDDVALVDPVGDTPYERIQKSLRVVPYYRYLRYERKPPIFLKALLPQGRDLENPFYYYRGDLQAEANKTYEILLKKMAAAGARIIGLMCDQDIVHLMQGLQLPNLTAAQFTALPWFPYRATGGHFGPTGNALFARLAFAMLTDRPTTTEAIVQFPELAVAGPRMEHAWSGYDEIGIAAGETLLGRFAALGDGNDYTILQNFKHESFTALLALRAASRDAACSFFIPNRASYFPGEQLELQLNRGGASRRYPLVELQAIDEEGKLMAAELGQQEFVFEDARFSLSLQENPYVCSGMLSTAAPVTRVRLSAGDSTALDATLKPAPAEEGWRYSYRVVFAPVHQKILVLSAAGDAALDLDTLPETGMLQIFLKDADGTVTLLPFATWRKTLMTFPLSEPCVQPIAR